MPTPCETLTMGNKNTFAIIGSIIGFLALIFAFLSPWIAEAIDPPPKPVEESVVDFATKLKDAAVAKMKGEEYKGEVTEKVPSNYLPPAVIAFGMIGAGFGVGSIFAGEKKSFSGCAITLGVSAVVVQWSIMIVAALIFVLLVMVVLGVLGGG